MRSLWSVCVLWSEITVVSCFVEVVREDITGKRSVSDLIPMNSPVSSPRPSEFQAHIYNSFLQGRTSDVAIRICASWNAIYNFHRVVLIQAVGTVFFCSHPPFTYVYSRNSFAIFSQEGLSSQRVTISPRGLAYPQVQ